MDVLFYPIVAHIPLIGFVLPTCDSWMTGNHKNELHSNDEKNNLKNLHFLNGQFTSKFKIVEGMGTSTYSGQKGLFVCF